MFDIVDVEKVRQECPEGLEESKLLDQRLDVLEWLQDEKLEIRLVQGRMGTLRKMEKNYCFSLTLLQASLCFKIIG